MPLSKARDRERKRLIRLESKDVQPKVVIPGLIMEGNRILGVQPKSNLPTEAKPNIPIYNPAIHKVGDTVLVRPQYGRSKKLIEITMPEMDADGNAMPE